MAMTRTDRACQLATEGCFPNPVLSRICERGTMCCGVQHQKAIEAALADVERSTQDNLETLNLIERKMGERCILDCDSPSYPPSDDERWQCRCRQCVKDLIRVERERCAQIVERSMTGLEVIKPQMQLLAAAIRQEQI